MLRKFKECDNFIRTWLVWHCAILNDLMIQRETIYISQKQTPNYMHRQIKSAKDINKNICEGFVSSLLSSFK